MNAPCGLEDCDCGQLIEKLREALVRLERVTGRLSVGDFTSRVNNGQILELMEAGNGARDALIEEAKP